MFEISGTVKGQNYEGQNISAQELIELFELPIKMDSRKGILQFELVDTQKKYDRANRMVAFQNGKMLRSLISGSYMGNHVNLQYYRRKTQKRENGMNITVYQPHHMEYEGNELAFSLDVKEYPSDLEQMVFFMLSTKCENSPIVSEYPEKYYQINDTVAKAEESVAKRTRMFEVYSSIMREDADMHLLRNKAAGMNIAEHTMLDVEVKAALLERAEQNIENFWKQYDNVKTTFDGIIARAIETGVIIQKNLGGGVQAYGFNEVISQRDHATPFQKLAQFVLSQDGRAELKKALSGNPALLQEISQHIEEVGLDKNVLEGLKDDMFKSTKRQQKVLKDAEDDEYTVAAEWAVKNEMMSIDEKTGSIAYKPARNRRMELGPINIDEDIAPQVAFLLSQDSGQEAFDSITTKMNQ